MTTGSNKQQWLVQIPGQPDSPVDTFTLSAWAKTKVIQPDTQVTDTEIKELASRMSRELGGHIFHSKIDWSNPTPWMKGFDQ